jgi:glutathione S-transferase
MTLDRLVSAEHGASHRFIRIRASRTALANIDGPLADIDGPPSLWPIGVTSSFPFMDAQIRRDAMYQLHYFPSNANAAPHMVLEEIGHEYELVLVDRASNTHKSKEYLANNPNGRIPTLVDGELVLFEAAAIVLHLVDRHPEADLAPKVGTPERARFYQWITFLTNSLQEELMIWQYPDRLTGTDAAATEIVRSGAEKRAGAYLDVIDRHLRANGPLFLGDKLSAVDFYLVMLSRWARPMSNPPRSRPHIARLLDMVGALPAVRRAYQHEGVTGEIC